MKKLIIVLSLICTLSGCDNEPETDPFNGVWTFGFTGVSGKFELKAYQVKSATVNNEEWTRREVLRAEPRSKIGQIILSKSTASAWGVSFFGCRVSSDKSSIMSDSVWVYAGSANYTVHKNYIIHRAEK